MTFLRMNAVLLCALFSLGFTTEYTTIPTRYFGAETTITVRIYKPEGTGPFPAVVWLHHCGGLAADSLSLQWVRRLTGWGYVVAVPDSFLPRGNIQGVCKDPETISASGPRVADAFATLRYLQSRADIVPSRIAVQGHSHGGEAAFTAAREHDAGLYAVAGAAGFAAAIAYYPYCSGAVPVRLASPLLVLIGAKDDWTPAVLCELAAHGPEDGPPLMVKTYPNAWHSFDDQGQGSWVYLGHHLAPDSQAAADSFKQVRTFLQVNMPDKNAR